MSSDQPPSSASAATTTTSTSTSTPRTERRDRRIDAQRERLTTDQVQKLSLIFSLMIGVASVLALWAGRERLILLVIPAAIVASVGAIVLTNPRFPRRRWLVTLAMPILFWTVGLLLNP